MFIEIGGRHAQAPEERNVLDAAPTELGNYCATNSINIPRLWRSGIREFASSIRASRTPYAAAPLNTQLETDVNKSRHSVSGVWLRLILKDHKRTAKVTSRYAAGEMPSAPRAEICAKTSLMP